MKDIQIQFNSDISKDNTEVRIAFYTNIGFFIEVAQILEFNLRKLICYELSVKEIEKEDNKIDDKYLAGAVTEKDGKVEWTLEIDVPGKSAVDIYNTMLTFLTDFTKQDNKL